MIFNIDFDGVLVSNSHEESLNRKVELEGYSYGDLSPIWDWYDKLVNTQFLPLNVPFLKVLKDLKEQGHILKLWTNRAYTLERATLTNLGDWKDLFDSRAFFGGRKHLFKVEGVVIDNNERFLSQGDFGILYPNFK